MKGSKSTSGFRKFISEMSRCPLWLTYHVLIGIPLFGRGEQRRGGRTGAVALEASCFSHGSRSSRFRFTGGCGWLRVWAALSTQLREPGLHGKGPRKPAQSPSTEYPRGTEELVYKWHSRAIEGPLKSGATSSYTAWALGLISFSSGPHPSSISNWKGCKM